MKRALIVGIDDYKFSPLSGCVNDAERMCRVLSKNQDGSPNFQCRKLVAPTAAINRQLLYSQIEELFSNEADVALFYFSGHGTINNLGGYLVTQDAERYSEGVSMVNILEIANKAKVREAVIILDCCHSGALGTVPEIQNERAVLREGLSVLTASRAEQQAIEYNGGGLFTSKIVHALEGGASDVIGKVTIASLYSYVDQILGAWEQRPLFKSHVSKLIPLRMCNPEVELQVIRLLPTYFPSPDYEYKLDSSYEPDADPRNPVNEKIFGHLQKFRAARLLVPVGEEHMYYAAIRSKSCKLTPLGQFYWHLANEGKL